MQSFKKRNEDTNRDYPTKKEYIEKIIKLHESELKSDRYISAHAFTSSNYWNRKNRDLEEELFKIVETYGSEDEMFNMPDDYKKTVRRKKYAKLKCFIDSLTEEQLDSNIFLKSASLFMKTSVEDCSIIINELNEIINNDNMSKSITVECDIPDKTKIHIPDYINTEIGIKYYKPEVYKVEYIDALDSSHKYVYEDYNECIRKISKIAEDIYFLQLNNIITTLSNDLICYHFQIYHPGYNNHFIASFFVKNKINKDPSNCETFIPTDDFIQITISNFQALLNMGLIDMAALENKNDEHILKKL